MKLFSTTTTRHLASKIELKDGACLIKQFNDGELFVRIDENVRGQDVWVLAGTQAPAEHLLELLFLCDALVRAGACVNLFITYFGYARQIIAGPGEACGASVIATIIKNIPLNKLFILHPHSSSLHDLLTFTAIRYYYFFCKQAYAFDAVAAPDKGAFQLAQEIALACHKELILLSKIRRGPDSVEIVSIEGQCKNKKVLLVDDIISTGRTIAESANAIARLGALSVSAAATHGVFSPGCCELLENSPIEQIYVTNSIAQESRGKINVVDISNFIQKIMQNA